MPFKGRLHSHDATHTILDTQQLICSPQKDRVKLRHVSIQFSPLRAFTASREVNAGCLVGQRDGQPVVQEVIVEWRDSVRAVKQLVVALGPAVVHAAAHLQPPKRPSKSQECEYSVLTFESFRCQS